MGLAWEHLQHLVCDGEVLSLDVFLPAVRRKPVLLQAQDLCSGLVPLRT